MADAPSPRPDPAKFPIKVAAGPTLVLPRRRPAVTGTRSPFELSEASAEARRSIEAIVTATRAPWSETATIKPDQISELENSLRQLETKLEERERAVEDMEAKLAERERDVAELEALLLAREKVLDATRRALAATPRPSEVVSPEEKAAFEMFKNTLDQQELSLKELKTTLAERESFIEINEGKLFAKMMQQQEKETEIEQQLEELAAREKRLRELEAAVDPAAAAARQAAEAGKKFDEFNE